MFMTYELHCFVKTPFFLVPVKQHNHSKQLVNKDMSWSAIVYMVSRESRRVGTHETGAKLCQDAEHMSINYIA